MAPIHGRDSSALGLAGSLVPLMLSVIAEQAHRNAMSIGEASRLRMEKVNALLALLLSVRLDGFHPPDVLVY